MPLTPAIRPLGVEEQIQTFVATFSVLYGLHGHRTGCERIRYCGTQERRPPAFKTVLEADLNLPIPFDGLSFDAAISLDVIIFSEMARLLVPTGRLLDHRRGRYHRTDLERGG